eukprot:scaffold56584_cov16-Tisochrysis_lutea.AAC.1
MQGFEKEGCGSSGFLMHCQLNLHLGIPASQGMIFLLVSQIMTMFFRAYEQTQSKNHTGRQKQCSFSIVNPPLNQSMIKVVPAEMRSPISWEACELTCPRRSSALPSYATGTLLRECYHGVQEFKSSTNSQLTDDCTLHSPPPKKTPIKQTTVQIWKEAKQKGGDFSKGMRVLGLYKLASILARSSSSNMLLVAERFVHGNKQKREVLKGPAQGKNYVRTRTVCPDSFGSGTNLHGEQKYCVCLCCCPPPRSLRGPVPQALAASPLGSTE